MDYINCICGNHAIKWSIFVFSVISHEVPHNSGSLDRIRSPDERVVVPEVALALHHLGPAQTAGPDLAGPALHSVHSGGIVAALPLGGNSIIQYTKSQG